MVDVSECIASRRSIRKFDKRPVDKSVVRHLINSAIHAPSACNMQAWKFIVIENTDLMNELVKYGAARWISNSPCGILVLYRNDVTVNASLYKDHYQSGAAAIQNILLEAANQGLAACWICDLPRPKHVRRIFHIPKIFDVIAYIAAGYPMADESELSIKHYGDEKRYKAHERKYGFDQVVSYNTFDYKKNDCTVIPSKKRMIFKRFWLKRRCFQNILFTDHMLKKQ